ncbi:MAG: iron-sulfur cluster assembly protein [Pseudomonadota bacterium]
MTIDLIKWVQEKDDAPENPLHNAVIQALRSVHDPEIPVNIYDLGLIYRCEVEDNGLVTIDMTLTTPNCPVAELIPQNVHDAVALVDGVRQVNVSLIWDPPWEPSKMSEDAKFALDMF